LKIPSSLRQTKREHSLAQGGLIVRYITHAFAHRETLERARRWLVQAGFDPGRIEVHRHCTPRLAMAVEEAGEAAEIVMMIDAVERTDPDGFPSFWDLARGHHVAPPEEEPSATDTSHPRSASFVVGWRPLDDTREVVQAATDLRLREAYVERGA
jgi:hypothetical protein